LAMHETLMKAIAECNQPLEIKQVPSIAGRGRRPM